MPLSCGLGHRQNSIPRGLHIVVGSHQTQGFIPRATRHAFPLVNHSICLPEIRTSFLQAVLHRISPPLSQLTHLTTTSTLPYTDPLSNLVILHSLHMAEPSENTFCHSAQRPSLCILDFIHFLDTQKTYKVVHMYSPNPRPLFLTPYHCLTTLHKIAHSSCKLLALRLTSNCNPPPTRHLLTALCLICI